MNDWHKKLGEQWNALKRSNRSSYPNSSNKKLHDFKIKIKALVDKGEFRKAIDMLDKARQQLGVDWEHIAIKSLNKFIEKKKEAQHKKEVKRKQKKNELPAREFNHLTHTKPGPFERFEPIHLEGPWEEGWALDLHTIKSIPLGGGRFDTTYTDVGKALNLLKYHQDTSQVKMLSNCVYEFMSTKRKKLAAIVPTPPSKQRDFQPVYEVALAVGDVLGTIVDSEYLTKIKDTDELKGINDPKQRREILSGAFGITDSRYMGKTILLFDDLYRSGVTLEEITKILYEQGKVDNVYVLTLTKTRTKR